MNTRDMKAKRLLLMVTMLFGIVHLSIFNFQFSIGSAFAQPAKRRTTTSNAAAQRGAAAGQQKQTADRASLMFPTSAEMPEDVVWRRDIYRQLDLLADKNAPLYYPVEPNEQQVNLFTYLFRLFLSGRIPAYTYKLDGNESFAEKDKVTDVKEILDRYYIYYEEKNGKYTVADNDVPSANVKRYYLKESSFFDQRTGTYKARVTALCPVLIEDDGFGEVMLASWAVAAGTPLVRRLNLAPFSVSVLCGICRTALPANVESGLQGSLVHDYEGAIMTIAVGQSRIPRWRHLFVGGCRVTRPFGERNRIMLVIDACLLAIPGSEAPGLEKGLGLDVASSAERAGISVQKIQIGRAHV